MPWRLRSHKGLCFTHPKRVKVESKMSTIYKYKLQPGRTVLDLPDGAKALTVQMQGPDVCLWALVEPYKPTGRRFFDVYGTGHPMPADPGDYVATFQMEGGMLVWHVFDATRTA